MKLAIMQPYFFPYIGYFQLIASVDTFILYDNIEYTKKGWINRNRMLQNGKDVVFSLPLKKDSDFLDICRREISAAFNRNKLFNQISGAYQRAPYFKQCISLVEQILWYEEKNLFSFLRHSIVTICEYLGINTKILISSSIDINTKLKSQDRVLALCEAMGASEYINAIGGIKLYSNESFQKKGFKLKFLKSKLFEYTQFGNEFVPWLSIIDVLMFNSMEDVKKNIKEYELV